jgi:aryl-alcohol dehydrogenase-like predicted oxidoreductase
MERRDFIRRGAFAAIAASTSGNLSQSWAAPNSPKNLEPIARRRLGKTDVHLSIIGMGGIVIMNSGPTASKNIVAEAVDRGINYFDVAPSYGDAQQLLGPALAPYRTKSFLACKTSKRDKAGSRAALEDSLRLLNTDHVDLYQFHALTKMAELDQVLGPNGAMETFEAARKEGKVRYIGFSAHSVETAVAAMDRYPFDTVLFPINWVLASQANFGPQVIQKAQEKGIGMLAIKSMSKTVWPASEKKDHPHSKCWYEPAEFPSEASLGLRWTLGHRITAAIPPGDEAYFRLAMDVAQQYRPLDSKEEQVLLSQASGVQPIFHRGNDV